MEEQQILDSLKEVRHALETLTARRIPYFKVHRAGLSTEEAYWLQFYCGAVNISLGRRKNSPKEVAHLVAEANTAISKLFNTFHGDS